MTENGDQMRGGCGGSRLWIVDRRIESILTIAYSKAHGKKVMVRENDHFQETHGGVFALCKSISQDYAEFLLKKPRLMEGVFALCKSISQDHTEYLLKKPEHSIIFGPPFVTHSFYFDLCFAYFSWRR